MWEQTQLSEANKEKVYKNMQKSSIKLLYSENFLQVFQHLVKYFWAN